MNQAILNRLTAAKGDLQKAWNGCAINSTSAIWMTGQRLGQPTTTSTITN